MDFESIPVLRFEIEGIKKTILSHLGIYGSEVGKRLEQEIVNAINSYDYQGEVDKIVHEAISDKLRDYFKFGNGSKIIKETLKKALDEAFCIPDK